jgi:hypothetical protein
MTGRKLPTIKTVVRSVIVVLMNQYAKEVCLQSLDELIAETSAEFKTSFSQFHGVLIPDGTSLVLHNPLRNGKLFYTAYKGHNSLRYFVLVNSFGRIVYVSKSYPGSKSDSHLWGNSGIADTLSAHYRPELDDAKPRKKIAIGGDKGYPNIDVDEQLFHVLVTDSASRTPKLKARGKKKTTTITTKLAGIRSVVERSIRRIKLFERLGSSSNQVGQGKLLYKATRFVCGFVNESLDLGELSLLTAEE